MKSTLICTHVMPREIELFKNFMTQYKKALLYLEDTDNVTIKASLNLNPELTDWDNSDLKPDYFISIFEELFKDVPNINEIILDNSLMGTTQQKRECIQLDYDQFIFIDADIAFPEQLLKYQLEASYLLEGKYILIPNVVKLGDPSWDVIVHDDFINNPFNQQHSHPPQETINQNINEIYIQQAEVFKFGCGMHTLYSKEFWDLIGIPEAFGGYGPEDTFGMYAASLAAKYGCDIKQYILKGIYTTEDYINRIPSFDSKIKVFDRKQEFRSKAEEAFPIEFNKFKIKIDDIINNSNNK
jgi:hypothetical protein